jgi:hypothetical protein
MTGSTGLAVFLAIVTMISTRSAATAALQLLRAAVVKVLLRHRQRPVEDETNARKP